jgi:hypothetical protein
VLITAADDRGYVGGSVPITVSGGEFPTDSCLNNNSPSSTPGNPAGGAYPTSTSSGSNPTNSSGGGGGGHSNVGPIVGGVIGGVAGLLAIALLALFFLRRRRFHRQNKERPVDLINDGDSNGHDDQLPQYYRPDPFVMPDPSVAGGASMREGEGAGLLAAGAAGTEGRASHESTTSASTRPPVMSALQRPATPDRRSSAGFGGASSSTTRKGGAPAPLRPVNIIQHDDGGRVPDEAKGEGEPETIELPPAYTNIRRGPSTRVPNMEEAPTITASSAETAETSEGTAGEAPRAPAGGAGTGTSVLAPAPMAEAQA